MSPPPIRRPARDPQPALNSPHAAALIWRYGADRALEIISGLDDATNEDLAKWRALGTGRAAR